MNNHWNMEEIWKISFFSHYENELFRIYLSLIWYLIWISCKLMHDQILTLIFCHQLEDNVVLCPWKSALSWIHEPGRVLPMLLQVAPQNGQYHEFWPCIPSRTLLPICPNQSFFKSAEFGGQSSGSSTSPPADMFSSKYRTQKRDGLRHMGNIGRIGIKGPNLWYWPFLGATWKSMGRTLPGSCIQDSALLRDRERHGFRADSNRFEYQR